MSGHKDRPGVTRGGGIFLAYFPLDTVELLFSCFLFVDISSRSKELITIGCHVSGIATV